MSQEPCRAKAVPRYARLSQQTGGVEGEGACSEHVLGAQPANADRQQRPLP